MSDIELFYSYSHKDEALKDQLLSHLSNLKRQGIIREWNDRAAGPGAREFDIEDMLERDWWKQDWHSTCLSRDAPTDMIASVGSGYQRLIVIPSMELIIVRLGQDAKFSDGDFLRILLGLRSGAEPGSVPLDVGKLVGQFPGRQ